MENIREFEHKLIEVSHFKIGVQLLKLWNLELQFWVPILTAIGNTTKSNMKMGYKFDSRLVVLF